MSLISKSVRAAVATRLSSAFNASLASAIATGSYGSAAAFTVDWSDNSKQFFQGQLHPDDLDESTPSIYPMVMLYSTSSQNQNTQKYTAFSGVVSLGLDFHLSWKSAKVLPAFDDLVDAVEDAVFATLNAASYQNWAMPVIYNGDITSQRRPLDMAGEHWRQTISFRLVFEVVTN